MACAGKVDEQLVKVVPRKMEPRRVNGTLKKVWKSVGNKGIDWVTLDKPPLRQKAAGSAAPPEQA